MLCPARNIWTAGHRPRHELHKLHELHELHAHKHPYTCTNINRRVPKAAQTAQLLNQTYEEQMCPSYTHGCVWTNVPGRTPVSVCVCVCVCVSPPVEPVCVSASVWVCIAVYVCERYILAALSMSSPDSLAAASNGPAHYLHGRQLHKQHAGFHLTSALH